VDETLEFASALGIHFICFLVGALFLAAVVFGLVRTVKERRQTAGKLITLLIVAPFALVFTVGPFLAICERYGLKGCLIQGAVFAVLSALIALPLLLRRGRPDAQEKPPPGPDTLDACIQPTSLLRRLGASVFSLYLVAAYAFAMAERPWSWLDGDMLVLLVQIEFLVIHSGVIIGFIAAVRTRRLSWNIVRWVVLGLLMCLYVEGALYAGPDGVWVFLWGAAATYSGVLLQPRSPDILAQTAKRWAASLAAYCIASIAFQLPEMVNDWQPGPRTFGFGLAYFAILAALEISPFYYMSWRMKNRTS
jgi:hypothetical protein